MSAPVPRWLRLLPIAAFQVYLGISILVFALGPWKWPLDDPMKLYLFVAAAHLALLLGYLSGVSAPARGYTGKTSPERLLRVSIYLTLLLYIPTLYHMTGGNIDPVGALRDPGSTYYDFQERVVQGSVGGRSVALLTYVRMLLAPILALLIPVLASRWSSLSRWERVLGVVAVLSNVSLFVFTGRNKGLIDFVLLAPWTFVIFLRSGNVRMTFRRAVVAVVVCVAGLFVFVDFFSRSSISRQGEVDIAFESVRLFGGLRPDLENFMVRDLSPENKGIVLGLSFNQTHGYYALALALDKPWVPSWGVGHSFFLQQMEKRFTGRTDLGDKSYPARLLAENGWSIGDFWHTTYTWFASDVSFPGTILLLAVLGRVLALAWNDTLRGDNPYAMGLFMLLVTMMYYLPTNNVVLGFAEALAAFWSIFALWQLTRRRVTIRRRAQLPALPGHAPAPAGAVAALPPA